MNARGSRAALAPAATIAPSALYVEVAKRLRERIFAHEFAPGEWLDEQALAAQYGISRTPLREALKVLAAEGMVTLKPRRGCYVTEVADRDLDEIFPVLALLEGRCAHEATLKATTADLRRLEALHDALETHASKGNRDRFFEANQDFHRAVMELAGNRWLAQVIQDLRKVLRLARHHSLLARGRVQQSLAEHRAILAAMRARDAERAGELMHLHLTQGRAAIAEVRAAEPAAADAG
ncbi:MAG: GntR family transcriptional regulator [Burkholderiales bacterium]|nr:GntR family transcriptional regulator [Burkholderiales bacterium]